MEWLGYFKIWMNCFIFPVARLYSRKQMLLCLTCISKQSRKIECFSHVYAWDSFYIVYISQIEKSSSIRVIKSGTLGKGIQIVPSNFTTVSALRFNSCSHCMLARMQCKLRNVFGCFAVGSWYQTAAECRYILELCI